MKTPRVTIDHWHTLQAVIDQGSYAQAAEYLHRSQSSVSYAIRKLEEQLGTDILVVKGRKAELTVNGRILLQRSRTLVEDAGNLEQLAADLNNGRETEIRLVVDTAFPFEILIHTLQQFRRDCGHTRILLEQVVLSGADDFLTQGQADLAVSYRVPADMLGDELLQIEFLAVAHPEHVLHQLKQPVTLDHLRDEMQIVIRDSGRKHKQDFGWLGAKQQWSVPDIESSLKLISHGMGYGWLPRHLVCDQLEKGSLEILPLREGQCYNSSLYLIFGSHHYIGPATRQLATLLRQNTKDYLT